MGIRSASGPGTALVRPWMTSASIDNVSINQQTLGNVNSITIYHYTKQQAQAIQHTDHIYFYHSI